MPITLDSLKSFLTEVWKKMPKLLLLLYFVIIAVLAGYLTCTLWLAAPIENAPSGIGSPLKCTDKPGDPPVIDHLDPDTVAIGENYVNVAVYGCNFKPDPKVKFDRVLRESSPLGDHELIVSLRASDFAAAATIAVSVETGPDAKPLQSPATNLRIKPVSDIKAAWNPWHCRKPYTITLELRLILLVLFTGLLAATIAGLKSFVEYVGDEKFHPTWYMFYCAEPFIGSGLALIFYFVIRAGFLAGTNADIKAVNPFGFVAIAALVGLFSDAAFRKLNEIFDSLLQAKDTRSGKLSDPVITSPPALPPVAHGAAIAQFTFSAKNGVPPYTWSVVGALPAGIALSAAGVLTGTAPATPGPVTFTVKVIDSAGASATQQCTLTVQ